MITIDDKTALFLAELMEQGADCINSRICEDMSKTAYNLFTPEEKRELSKAFHEWNGDPEEYESNPDYFSGQAGHWLDYFAAQFRKQAAQLNYQNKVRELAEIKAAAVRAERELEEAARLLRGRGSER